jgi:hypothetical protein
VASISRYRIELSAQQRGELDRRARAYTEPYHRVVRAKIVLMAAGGLANGEIAAPLDTSPQVVHRRRKRFLTRVYRAWRTTTVPVDRASLPPRLSSR